MGQIINRVSSAVRADHFFFIRPHLNIGGRVEKKTNNN